MPEPNAAAAPSFMPAATEAIPAVSLPDTVRFKTDVTLPALAKGVIVRRPHVTAIAEFLDIDRRAIRRIQRLQSQHGSGPLRFRIFGRDIAFVLKPEQVHRVLSETPEPFSTVTLEKTAALAHLEPKNVLISLGTDRTRRPRYNEEVLDTNRPFHRLGGHFLEIAATEAKQCWLRCPKLLF